MRALPRRVALAALAALSFLPAAVPAARAQAAPALARTVPVGDSAVAREVLRLTRVWHDAIMRADTARLRQILASDFSLTLPPDLERGHISLQDYLGNVRGYHLLADRWEASDVRVLGDVVVVTSRFWQRATTDGEARNGYFVLTDVWRRRGSTWQVATRWSTWLDMPGGISPAARKARTTTRVDG